jgi:hypothetical protein
MMIREGYFQDKRSFISLPGDDGESHVFLKGRDWEDQKSRVWQRDKGHCKICGFFCDGCFADPDHIIKRSKGGSDDIGNLRTVHRTCHNKRHPEKQVGWSAQKQQAHRDFAEVMDKETK